MYIVTNKENNKITCIEENKALSIYINVAESTIYRRFKTSKVWEDDKYHIRIADEFIRRTRKTGFTRRMREDKAEKDRY